MGIREFGIVTINIDQPSKCEVLFSDKPISIPSCQLILWTPAASKAGCHTDASQEMSYSATHCWFGWPRFVPTNGDKPIIGVFREIVPKIGKTIKSENMEHNSPVQLAIQIGYPPPSRPTFVGFAEYICLHPLLWNPWDYEWQSTTPHLFVAWTTIIHCGTGAAKKNHYFGFAQRAWKRVS